MTGDKLYTTITRLAGGAVPYRTHQCRRCSKTCRVPDRNNCCVWQVNRLNLLRIQLVGYPLRSPCVMPCPQIFCW